MLPFQRYVAPSGAPIHGVDLLRWASRSLSSSSAGDGLRRSLSQRLGPGHYFLSGTGRAGMTILLKALRRLAPASRDEVLVPSYTCYSVAASAVKAGLKVRIVDTNPGTLDYAPADLAAADFTRVLAIVATNLYGLPSNMPLLSRLARERGAFLIDDAAQALGASVGGRMSGTWGDAGLFSFDKGKNLTAIDGGVVFTTSADVAAALDREMAGIGRPSAKDTALTLLKVLGYALMLRPRLYGLPAQVPQLGLGRTIFDTGFPLTTWSPPLTALGATMMERLTEFTESRVANAVALSEVLAFAPGMRVIKPLPAARPVYLRLPVLFESPLLRDQAIAALNAAGIGATGSYPASLVDVPELRSALAGRPVSAPGGRRVASTILTLPTHPYVLATDVARAGRILREIRALGDRRGVRVPVTPAAIR
jgi:dTDP-4-amino-4,6-dideoxygalactose transaminase